MDVYDSQPWQALYEPGTPTEVTLEHPSVLAAFRASVDAAPDVILMNYFDSAFTVADVDRLSSALAAALIDRGVGRGDRLALYLQNIPQFVIACVAAWKLGAIVVPLNPMLRAGELRHQLSDSGSVALISLDSLYDSVAREVLPDTAVRATLTTSGQDFQTRNDPRVFADTNDYECSGTDDFLSVLEAYAGQVPPRLELAPDEVAVLTYTSGTTGVPKAAMNSHGNVVSNAQATRNWMALGPQTPVLGVAPLFHITGLVCQVATSLLTPAPVVLSYRFEPEVMLESIREHRPAFAVAAVTAYRALTSAKSFTRADFESFERLYSGGAPVSPASADRFQQETGHQLHGAFGMTETSAPTHFAPFGVPGKVDPASGALTIGIPTPGTCARVVDEAGLDVEPGEPGELLIKGPQVTSGYWNRPEETAAAIRDGWLHSGDIAVMDPEGWFFIVDRKKDVIISSGYKVWPREVEDVLNSHPLVQESAVVGVPDAYRGETVKAFVSLRGEATVDPDELIRFVGDRLSAYKRPRYLVVLPELPKTISGKILRRELRGR